MDFSAPPPLRRRHDRFPEPGYRIPAGTPMDEQEGPDEDAADEPAAGVPAENPTVRVLVVDDQPDVLATTVELFKMMGYEVLGASNGHDAVDILKRTPDIQVLFSDVMMPGMNGVKLGHEARRLIPGINVILASGFQSPSIQAGSAGVHDFHFLAKPFRFTDVARLLRK